MLGATYGANVGGCHVEDVAEGSAGLGRAPVGVDVWPVAVDARRALEGRRTGRPTTLKTAMEARYGGQSPIAAFVAPVIQ